MKNLREVYNIFEEIRTTGSTNDKKLIIDKHKDNELFLFYLEFLCNTHKKTGISKLKLNKSVNCSITISFKSLEDIITYITENNTGTDAIIRGVQSYTRVMIDDDDLYEFSKQLITKSYKLGIKDKLVNAVIPGLITSSEGDLEIYPMLAKKFDFDKYKGEEICVTEKIDGVRLLIFVIEGKVSMYTRQGKLATGLVDIDKDILSLGFNNVVFDGEILAKDCGYNTVYKETIKRFKNKHEIKTGLEYCIFDMLSLNEYTNKKCKNTYEDRRIVIDSITDTEYVSVLKVLYKGNDVSKVVELLDEYRKLGAEGLMVSYADKYYEFKRSSSLEKVKVMQSCDVRVIDVIEGDGQNKGKLGAIIVEFEHNNELYRCKIGTGFTQDMRVRYYNNPELIVDKICEVNYFEVTHDVNGNYGLRFGVWNDRIRDDKTEISMH